MASLDRFQEREDVKALGMETFKAGKLRFVDYVGLGCQTTFENHSFFFLFADVDTKSLETLRLAQQIFARHELGFYWYETSKGWHIVSPNLLNISEWDRARQQLKEVLDNYYRNLVLRIERKAGDSLNLNWDNFNLNLRHLESEDLHRVFQKKFNHRAPISDRCVRTNLQFTHYTQVREIE